MISACEAGFFQTERPETPELVKQTQKEQGYWSAALEAQRELLITAGMKPVAESNAELYKAAIAREIMILVDETAEVEEGENLVLLRLSAEHAFGVGSAELSDQAAKQLEGCARVFTNYDLSLLEISGHTDNTGSEQINRQLSEHRARSVAELLQASGLDPMRMVVEGRSDTQPLEDNASPEGRRINRRVEIRVIPLLAGQGLTSAVNGRE
ncbi:MAG: OmpA family protein [Gammaproteobacteria bacterium]|nr:OmpA family protein [Gammaproteobacteria bacterium]